MLKVRLQRVGRRNDPSFRMVVIESTKGPKSRNYIEMLGSYNPRQKGNTTINGERVKHWIAQGAQVSDTVHNILVNEKVIDGKKINVLPKKAPIVSEKEEATEAPADEAKAEDDTSTDDAPAEAEEEKKEDETPAEEPKEEPAPEVEAKPEAEDNSEEDKKEEAA